MTRGTLTNTQRSEFQRDGFLKLPALIGVEQVDLLKRRIEQFVSGDLTPGILRQTELASGETEPRAGGKTERDPVRKFQHVAASDDLFSAHMNSEAVRNVLSSILGASFLVYSDIIFMKPAQVGSRQPYHQDRVLGYHIDAQAPMAGLWFALDAATEANGCLRFIPGSHKARMTLEQAQEIEDKAISAGIENEMVVEAEPGDAILIDSLVLHASEPNRSDVHRWVYSCFCVSCDALFTGPNEDKPDFLVLQGTRKPGRI